MRWQLLYHWLDERTKQARKGQVIILIAFLFIALVALVGLVVDVGTVLLRYAQMRSATDAAAIQATNQFREFRKLYDPVNGQDMYTAAAQIMATHGFYPPETFVRVFACTGPDWTVEKSEPPIPNWEPSDEELNEQLCPHEDRNPPVPPRKLVRVDAQAEVGLPFLSVVGWKSIFVRATSVGEAASIDLVLVLDRSRSMARESKELGRPWNICWPARDCQPFESVRSNAMDFIDKLYFPYDRVAIIQFDRDAMIWDTATMTWTTNTDVIPASFMFSGSVGEQVRDAAKDVLQNHFEMQTGCPEMPGLEGWGCVGTNIGGALRLATRTLAVQGRLRATVWMILLLSDGAPNATNMMVPNNVFTEGACPPNSWPKPGGVFTNVTGYKDFGIITSTAPYAEPLCLSLNGYYVGSTWHEAAYSQIRRTCIYTDANACGPGVTICAPGVTIPGCVSRSDYLFTYDAADYTRDQADYMARNGIIAFVIGLGPYVSGVGADINRLYDGGFIEPPREPNGGERLLRYIADMGYDPDEKLGSKRWPCHSNYWAGVTELPRATDCGNYWYAARGDGLKRVFEEIASRMFTRLQQ